MIRKVVISKTTEKKLDALFSYLVEKWSTKVKNEFIEKLDYSIQLIRNQPEMFPESKQGKKLRKCVVTKHTTLFYRCTTKKINVVTIFETRQNAKKLKKDI